MLAPSPSPIFHKVTIVGMGLIGSSLARALRARPYEIAGVVAGTDQSAAVMRRVAQLHIVDAVEPTLHDAVADADCVILCIPVRAFKTVVRDILPRLPRQCIITDVGSTKASVLRDLVPLLPPGVELVAAHPLAGSDQSGPNAGMADLFMERLCIITPSCSTSPAAINKITRLWHSAGAQVEIMSAERHDTIMAFLSHLPHLIAFAMCRTVGDVCDGDVAEFLKYAASGFRDFTRIARSDATMWRDIFLNNREAVLNASAALFGNVNVILQALVSEDDAAIEDHIQLGRKIRELLVT
jgi:cyclohexadieny/prephenate dehydrogenase